jgi:cellulose synthase/poly-beta-1,6-N-acetylglucosamine synthase-like glycosyltransferase
MLDNLFSYVGYVVAALGGTNAVAPVWPRRSDKQLHTLSPLYNALFIALYFLCTNALFIALYFLCTMRYLSLYISFVQCVMYR